jgi:hypothetical protein
MAGAAGGFKALKGGNPKSASLLKTKARPREEQTPEGVRNAERGRRRRVGPSTSSPTLSASSAERARNSKEGIPGVRRFGVGTNRVVSGTGLWRRTQVRGSGLARLSWSGETRRGRKTPRAPERRGGSGEPRIAATSLPRASRNRATSGEADRSRAVDRPVTETFEGGTASPLSRRLRTMGLRTLGRPRIHPEGRSARARDFVASAASPGSGRETTRGATAPVRSATWAGLGYGFRLDRIPWGCGVSSASAGATGNTEKGSPGDEHRERRGGGATLRRVNPKHGSGVRIVARPSRTKPLRT